jgi:hypothetical protein
MFARFILLDQAFARLFDCRGRPLLPISDDCGGFRSLDRQTQRETNASSIALMAKTCSRSRGLSCKEPLPDDQLGYPDQNAGGVFKVKSGNVKAGDSTSRARIFVVQPRPIWIGAGGICLPTTNALNWI